MWESDPPTISQDPELRPAATVADLLGAEVDLESLTNMCYKNYVTSVGVRELRQRASELLRLVEQGETVEITDRGRPVARLTPLPEGTPLEQMRSSGEIDPASGHIDDLPEPITLPNGVEPPSAALGRLRDER